MKKETRMIPINRQELEIPELRAELADIDLAMTSLREEKERIIVELRKLQRVRDAITEPLERKTAIESLTKPTTIIGL
jgi:hypothetical protein